MGKLVPKVSVPIMISMLVQAMYNVVDSIFVARYDPNALTAVSLAYPVQMLMIAVGTGLGVGINSLVSRRLGEGKADAARDASVSLRQIEARQQAPDHPVLWGVPETFYLKFYLFQVV